MNKNTQSLKRQLRIRKNIRTNSDRARLSVFRSNMYLYAQIVDDKIGKTLIGVSEKSIDGLKGTKSERAKQVGLKLAEQAKKNKIENVVFDKGRYAYHGRIKSLAEGAREGGLKF